MSAAARAAADVASLLDPDDPLARLARLRLDALVREEAMTTITAPLAGVNGLSQYGGDFTLTFVNGVAVHEGELPEGVRRYLIGAGFGLDGEPARNASERDEVRVVDGWRHDLVDGVWKPVPGQPEAPTAPSAAEAEAPADGETAGDLS